MDSAKACLEWQLRAIFTYQPIYDPFKCDFEWSPKWKIRLNVKLPKKCQAEKKLKSTLAYSNVSSTNGTKLKLVLKI